MGEGIFEGLKKRFSVVGSERTKPVQTILGVYNLGKLAQADELFPELTRDFLEMEATLRRKQAIGRAGGIDISAQYKLVPVIALQRVKGQYVMDYYMEWRDKDGNSSVYNSLYGRRRHISGLESMRLRKKLAKYDEFDPDNP